MCSLGTTTACINAATLALIDAGIPMKDYVCAVTAGVIDGTVVLDLNTQERSANGPYLTVALMPKTEKIVHTQVCLVSAWLC